MSKQRATQGAYHSLKCVIVANAARVVGHKPGRIGSDVNYVPRAANLPPPTRCRVPPGIAYTHARHRTSPRLPGSPAGPTRLETCRRLAPFSIGRTPGGTTTSLTASSCNSSATRYATGRPLALGAHGEAVAPLRPAERPLSTKMGTSCVRRHAGGSTSRPRAGAGLDRWLVEQ